MCMAGYGPKNSIIPDQNRDKYWCELISLEPNMICEPELTSDSVKSSSKSGESIFKLGDM